MDLGDAQSLEQSLSTFSGHVRRLRNILAALTPHSLVSLAVPLASRFIRLTSPLGRRIWGIALCWKVSETCVTHMPLVCSASMLT